MKREPILEFVLRHLEANKGKHREIATKSGVPYSTVAKIYQGVTPNPGVNSVQALADYFAVVHTPNSDARARKSEYSEASISHGVKPQ